jgi:GNAT superfamily N-acetyltransferase
VRYAYHRFDDLPPIALRRLCGLTNDPDRGDIRDDGSWAGSLFRSQLDERLMGESFPNSHIVLATHFRYAGWCMVTRHDLDPNTGRKLQVPSATVGFYVHPDFRRQGVGRRLIQEACEVAQKNGIGRLLANPWNQRSLSFFQSCGFEPLDGYCIPGWAGVVAVLDLEPIRAFGT